MHRLVKTPVPAMLAAMLVVHGGWCFCGTTCCAQGDAPATVATDAPVSDCGCSHETPSRPCCGQPASGSADSCCGCCVKSPISRPSNGGDVGLRQPTPFYPGPADNGLTLAYAAPVAVRLPVRTQARHGLPLYLQLEVLRI